MKSGRKVNGTKLIRAVSVLCMFALICGAWCSMGNLVKDKTMSGTSQLYNFYQLEKNTVDVLLVGSSHTYSSVNTCMLFDEYGITSFDMACGGQPVWISYTYLEEGLKTQRPKLIVCDIFMIQREKEEITDAALRGLINIKMSPQKWKAINVSSNAKVFNSLGIFLNFPYTHTRYGELTESDFLDYSRENFNGYMPYWGVGSEMRKFDNEIIDAASVTESEPIAALAEEYLRKVCELCVQEDIPLLLMNPPFPGLTEEAQRKYNYAEAVAGEYGVPVLDGNKYVEEIGIVWTEDMYDTNHLNYQGSLKFTKWLGEYLNANYDLKDHSNDPRYQHWADESDRFYHEAVLSNTLAEIDEAGAYIRELQANSGLSAAVTLTGKWEKSEEDISGLMRELNPDWNRENALLLDEETVVFSASASEEDYREHFDYGRVVLELSQESGKAAVRSNEEEYQSAKNGINFVVYDKIAQAVIDSACFNLEKGVLKRTS